jgi:protein transport protein SEC20
LTDHSYEKDYRRAYLYAKKNLEAAQKQERELLLQSYMEPRTNSSSPVPSQYKRKQQIEMSKEEREINATSDITMALRRTHDMMTAELSRSQFARETLNESSAALAQLSESYNTLDNLLSNSKNLLGTLLRSQKSDTWYLETAFYVLAATIAWLVFRRLLYGPMWWLLWFPMKIFIRSWIGVFTAMGLLSGSSVAVSSASSVVERETVIHNSATRSPLATISGMRAPSVNVGGGGRGAPMIPVARPRRSVPEGTGHQILEQVGRIIDESQNEAVPDQESSEEHKEEEAENQPNPKKRMWEEEKEAAKEEQKNKDEL